MIENYQIVISENASECETYAAEELQKYIRQSTQQKFPIIKDNETVENGKYISVGDTALAKALNTKNLKMDGFRIKTDKNNVLIKGQRNSATLFGVYDFLERFLGVKFLTADYVYVPKTESFELGELDITEIPSFEKRFYHTYTAKVKQAGMVRMRLQPNYAFGDENEKRKFGELCFENIGRYHAYSYLVPFEKYGEQHPEWFADPNAIPAKKVQPSLANGLTDDGEVDESMDESVLKTVIEAIKKKVLENPLGRYVCLGSNDCHNWCKSEKDQHQREIFGGLSGQSVVFTNAVAKAVDEWLEKEKIDRKLQYWMFAYGRTVEPPDLTAEKAHLVKTRDNVYIHLALLEDAWNVPLNDPRNTRAYRVIPIWQQVSDNFYMYDYTGNFNNIFNWSPTLTVLKPNVLYYKELGVEHYTSEGGCFGYVNKVKIYVLSKLMWNVDRNVDELITEFNRYYFGEKAGKVLDEMVAFCNAHYQKISLGDEFKKAGLYDVGSPWQKSPETLNVEFVGKVQDYVQKAKALLEDEDQLSRFNDLELMVDMMKYLNYDALWKTTDEEKQHFLQDFYSRVKKSGVLETNKPRFGSKWEKLIPEEFAQYGIY